MPCRLARVRVQRWPKRFDATSAHPRSPTDARDRDGGPSLLFRGEGLLDLLLDALVILREELLFFRGQDAKRYAQEAVLELHVEPVLPVRDAARNLEIEAPDTGTVIAEFNRVVRQCPR